jgi:hypothetical protein
LGSKFSVSEFRVSGLRSRVKDFRFRVRVGVRVKDFRGRVRVQGDKTRFRVRVRIKGFSVGLRVKGSKVRVRVRVRVGVNDFRVRVGVNNFRDLNLAALGGVDGGHPATRCGDNLA